MAAAIEVTTTALVIRKIKWAFLVATPRASAAAVIAVPGCHAIAAAAVAPVNDFVLAEEQDEHVVRLLQTVSVGRPHLSPERAAPDPPMSKNHLLLDQSRLVHRR